MMALGGGAALPLAFAPFELYGLAPLLLALLFWLWHRSSHWREAVLIGWLFGVGMFGVGVSWVQVSMSQFGGVSPWGAGGLALLFVFFLALFPALQGGVIGWLRPFFPRLVWVAMPLVWVMLEWGRSHLLGGFPWLLLGHTAPGTPYRGVAPLVGTYGVSLLLAITGLLLLWMVVFPRWRGRVAIGLLLLLTLVMTTTQHHWGEPLPQRLTVALVQGNIPQSQKWLVEMRGPTLARYHQATASSAARLVIWPETAVTMMVPRGERGVLRGLQQQLAQEGRTLIAGAPLLEPQRQRYYNGMVMLGAEQGEYRKRRLVPLGEYLPFSEILGPLMQWVDIPLSSFSPGEWEQPPLQVDDLLLAPTICYEVAYPQIVFSALPQAGALLTISNDAWFGDSLAPAQHLQIARMRALESARPLLRATNTGITALIGPDGEVIAQLPQREQGVLELELQPWQGETPYLRWLNG